MNSLKPIMCSKRSTELLGTMPVTSPGPPLTLQAETEENDPVLIGLLKVVPSRHYCECLIIHNVSNYLVQSLRNF